MTIAAAVASQTAEIDLSGAAAADIHGDSLASGNDFRVLRYSGSAWTELDRDLVTWNAGQVQAFFRMAAAWGAGASEYWVYYANPGAGAPPARPNRPFARP